MFATHPRLLLIVNDAGFFVSHRLPVALAARDAGFDVHVATAGGNATAAIHAQALPHYRLPLSRGSTNPATEVLLFAEIMRLLQRLRPDVAHFVTVKPVIYGGIAARLTGVPAVVSAISGLGQVFVARGLRAAALRRLVTFAYSVALHRERQKVLFQNASDREMLVRMAGLRPDQTVMMRGSGVDLHSYHYTPEPDGIPVVTFASRLLKTKGVYEFVAAAKQLRSGGLTARFQLVGGPDPGNSSSVSEAEITGWRSDGAVEVLGHRGDMASVLAASNLVVLPSYYGEGLPKVLAEAAACGRAVVTTDMPGCRDAVDPGRTALLIPPRDPGALAQAIRTLIDDPARRRTMGLAARALAERDYAIEDIVAAHLGVYRSLTESAPIAGAAP